MVVMIRLKRTGRRNRACFRLNAIEGRNPRDGRVLESLGLYDPLAPRVEDQLKLKADRIQYWLSVGAQLSETARSLCRRQGIELPEKKAPRKRNRKQSPARVAARFARDARIAKAKKERREARLAAKKKAAAEAAAAEQS